MVHLNRLAFLAVVISYTNAFQSPVVHNKIRTPTTLYVESSDDDTKPALSSLVNRVAVAGATGRTGKFVVQQLLEQNVPVLVCMCIFFFSISLSTYLISYAFATTNRQWSEMLTKQMICLIQQIVY